MNKVNQKILITGATGFVGQALCKALVGKGLDVQILLRDPASFHKIPLELGAGMFLGTLDNEASLAVACAGVDQVIHLAGLAHASSQENELKKVNVDGTQNLLSAAIKAGVGKFIFLSSSLASAAEAGTGDITHYGQTKVSAEELLQEAANKQLIEAAILRPVNVYGPGMKGNIARMIELIDKGRLPPLPDIENRISLISSEDLAHAIITVLDAESLPAAAMTVTDGAEYSIKEIESSIYANLGKTKASWRLPFLLLYCAAATAGLVSSVTGRGSINARTYRNLIKDNLFPNDERIVELGYVPKSSFYESLPEIIQASRNRR